MIVKIMYDDCNLEIEYDTEAKMQKSFLTLCAAFVRDQNPRETYRSAQRFIAKHMTEYLEKNP